MELIALLIIVLGLLAAEYFVFKKLVLRDIEYSVRFSTQEAFEGDTIEIIEEVENRKWLPVPWLKTELSTSRWLEFTGSSTARASDTRFVPSVFVLMPYQRCVRTRKAVALKRGEYRLESLSIIGSDLLGLVSASKSVKFDDKIRILPSPYEVSEGELSERELSGELLTRRFICDDPFMRSGAREYTGREPMNRICWNSTARKGTLMAYQNDFTTTNRVLLVINMQRDPVGDPRPPASADIETMIKAAAFIIQILAAGGRPADLAASCALTLYVEGGARQENHMKLLRALSSLEDSCGDDFVSFFRRLKTDDFTDIVVFTPYIDGRLMSLARKEKLDGRKMIFYCCGSVSDESGVIPMGRLHKYVFM